MRRDCGLPRALHKNVGLGNMLRMFLTFLSNSFLESTHIA